MKWVEWRELTVGHMLSEWRAVGGESGVGPHPLVLPFKSLYYEDTVDRYHISSKEFNDLIFRVC